jgi:hypothetical protein
MLLDSYGSAEYFDPSGHRRTLEGAGLIVCLKVESQAAFKVRLEPQGETPPWKISTSYY